MAEAPRFTRSVLGYSPASVRRILADRDAMFLRAREEAARAREEAARAREEAERAWSRVTELEARVQAAAEDLQRQQERAEAAEARVAELEAQLQAVGRGGGEGGTQDVLAGVLPPGRAGLSVRQELSALLANTERAVARIIEGARRTSEQELQEAERVREQVQARVAQLEGWLQHVTPLIGSTRTSVEEARARVGEVADRIRTALAPITEAMDVLAGRLAELARAPMPATEGVGEARPPAPPEAAPEPSPAPPEAAPEPSPAPPEGEVRPGVGGPLEGRRAPGPPGEAPAVGGEAAPPEREEASGAEFLARLSEAFAWVAGPEEGQGEGRPPAEGGPPEPPADQGGGTDRGAAGEGPGEPREPGT